MKLEECKVGMQVRWPQAGRKDAYGTITEVKKHVGAFVEWANAKLIGFVTGAWYLASLVHFEPATPKQWLLMSQLCGLSAIAAGKPATLAPNDDDRSDLRFFAAVQAGHCPCAIVRSQCRYHG